MYKIGIIGHGPEHLHSVEGVESTIAQTIDLLCFQYGDQMVYNIMGNVGVGLLAAKACYEKDIPYHIILPYQLSNTIEYWYEEQQEELKTYLQRTRGITICFNSVDIINTSYTNLVDNSNFVICFWNGKKQGKTYDAIRYALTTNKLILNGLNDLKLITNRDIHRKRKIY